MSDNTIDLSRRKILAGLGAVGAAGAGAGLGTSALFSDEASFDGNVITAGTLDLAVGYYSYWDQGIAGSGSVSGSVNGETVSAELTDVKPGDSGLLTFCPVIEDNPAYLWLCGRVAADDENGLTDPEAEVDSSGGDPGEGQGELAENIMVRAIYCDVGDIGEGEEFTPEDVSQVGDAVAFEGTLQEMLQSGIPLDGDAADAGAGDQACFDGSEGDVVNPCLCIEWEVPIDVGNEIQSDSVRFDLSMYAQQCRHNDGTTNPCEGDVVECPDCSFDTDATGDGLTNLLSVGPDPTSGFPAIDARVRVDTPTGNAGDLTASNFAICEDGCGQTLDNVAFESGGAVDIVVVFDDTSSMGDEIDTMQDEVTNLTDDLVAAGIDARYALVSFNDQAERDQDFTADASTFDSAVNGLTASGGLDIPEDNLDAVAVGTGNAAGQDGDGASLSAFRSGAQRVLIDITDAPAQEQGDHSDDVTDPDDAETRFSQSDVEGFLNDGNFSYYAVSPPESDTGPVSKETIAGNVDDGTWIDIDGADFGTILDDIVGSITDPAYVISYTTTNPATDGSSRTVDLEVDDPDEGLMYEEGTYTAPS